MPERSYFVYLDEDNSIFVYFETAHGVVSSFVVKYLAFINGTKYEVLRFDSAHETPHIDVLGPDGETKQKIWLHNLSNKEALNYAKENIKEYYQQYRERFTLWLQEEKQ